MIHISCSPNGPNGQAANRRKSSAGRTSDSTRDGPDSIPPDFADLFLPHTLAPPTSIKVIFVVSGVTILLSLTVFHNIVTETLPQVSDAMPLLGTYESASMSTLPLPSISVVIVTCPTNRE